MGKESADISSLQRQFDLVELLHQEAHQRADQGELLSQFKTLLIHGSPAFLRDHFTPGHFTGSGFVLSSDRTRAVLVHHRKIGQWLQPGGHADGELELAQVAKREVLEETGLKQVRFLTEIPIDLDIHQIPPHGGEPEHLHFDVRYLFQTDEEQLRFDPRESLGVQWFLLGDLCEGQFEPSVKRLANAALSFIDRHPSGARSLTPSPSALV